MIRLSITSATMPISNLTFGAVAQTRKGLMPVYSCKVKFDRFYGQLDMTKSWKDALGIMTPEAQLELCRSLVSKDWDPSAEPQNWFQRQFKKKPAKQPQAEKPVTAPAEEWKCSCGKEGNKGAFCPACGTKRPEPQPKAEPWVCSCGKSNDGEAGYCEACGKAKPVTEQPKKKLGEMTEDEVLDLLRRVAATAKAPDSPEVKDVDPKDLKPADLPAGTEGN